jgi:hypothetical protein
MHFYFNLMALILNYIYWNIVDEWFCWDRQDVMKAWQHTQQKMSAIEGKTTHFATTSIGDE